MTQYWWMHWFWITLWMSVTSCKDSSANVHSRSSGILVLNMSNVSNRSANNIEAINNLPTLIIPLIIVKNSTPTESTTVAVPTETFAGEIDDKFHYHNNKSERHTKSVIQKNISDPYVSDNELILNTNFNVINHTVNETFLRKNVCCNHSLARNKNAVDPEEEQFFNISDGNISAAGITGITLGCIIIVGLLSGISYFIYRNQGFNRPQVLNDSCSNPDSSGYIDDASVRLVVHPGKDWRNKWKLTVPSLEARAMYYRLFIPGKSINCMLKKDNSEEMYSLDNDSFLNSLEAMTFQNYWTDTVKHTKL